MISVIIPIYKVEAYLRRCVDSVLAQTYTDLEVILVDDGSPDGCGAICDEYAQKDSRVKVIHQENGGVSRARNAGLDAATGEYIGFVDADDYIDPDMYEKLVDAISRTQADVAECNYRREEGVADGDGELHVHTGMEAAVKMFTEDGYPVGFTVSPCTKLIRRDAAAELRFLEGCTMGEDTLFVTQVFCGAGKAVKLNRRLYTYRITENSATSRENVVCYGGGTEGVYMTMKVLDQTGNPQLRAIGRNRYIGLLLKDWLRCRRSKTGRTRAKELRTMFLRDYPLVKRDLSGKLRIKGFLFRWLPGVYLALR